MGLHPYQSNGHRRRILAILGLFCAALLSVVSVFLSGNSASAAAADMEATEPDLKAAITFQFGVYTTWPTNSFTSTNSPFVIGIIDNEEVARALDDIARPYKVQSRDVKVLRLNPEDDLTQCHLLFLGARQNAEPLLRRIEGKSILTVGEQARFAEIGGMINLVRVRDRITWDVNRTAIRDAGLRVDSRVLNLSRRILEPESRRTRQNP